MVQISACLILTTEKLYSKNFQNERAALIDGKIIDGHVIPKKVLFTAPTKKDVPFETLANGDNNVRVVISFTQENRGPNNIISKNCVTM